MKVDLEIIYSCTIKKKKSCPKIKWIGKEREKLYVLESQKVSSLDPNNGNVKRISSRIKSFQKSIVSHNITDNGIYFVAVLVNGDILIWNKDTDTIKIVNGMSEFALKLNNHGPNVFLSNDAKKIILIRNSNKIFVWESEDTSSVVGNWSNIVASKEIKTVEDHKELVIHVRFVQNSISGTHANCCFVFNHENKTRINVLRIKWDNCNTKPSECRFNTMWISHEPTLENFLNQRGCDKNENLNSKQNANFEPLNTRGAYVLKISHNSDLAVLAVNQRKIENCLLLFFSLSNGKIREVNLRNFGLNGSAQGRKYWIQELCWTFNDLFVAGISKHGAFFLVTRLGQPLFIHALGKEINIGPALFLTIHPLILVRGKNDSTIKNDESSINSTLNNGKHQKQIFSISQHPSLPIVVCSDGFLMCILKIPSAFAEPLRLVKEFVNEAVEQMNSISKSTDKHRSFHFPRYQQNDEDGQKFKTKKKRSVSFESNIPDWGLETRSESNFLDKSSDSGVDSINELNKQNKTNGLADHKIADGKIIFSFLPQVLPISDETMSTQSLSSKLEICISYLTCSWSLMVSLNNYDSVDFNENEIVCRAIQQAFINFTTLFLNAEFEAIKDFVYFSNHDLAQSEQIDIKKFKVLVKIFFIFVKTLNFACTDSIHFVHISQFVQKFNQSILKFNNSSVEVDGDRSSSRIYILSLAYNVLKCSQTILKEVFDQQQSESFLIKFDSIECKQNTQHCKELANVNARKQLESHEPSDKSNGSESDRFETDSLEKLNSKKRALILKKSSVKQALNQIDLMLQKGWTNLVHYASKYRKTLQSLGKIRQDSLNQINLFVIFVQREIEKLSNFRHFAWEKSGRRAVVEQVSNRKSLSNFKVAKADLVYFNLGNLDKALDFWTIQLNSMFDQGHTFALEQTSIAIVHKIFYSCLTKYEIGKFLAIVEKFLECEQCKYSKSGQSPFSRFSLFENSFRSLCAPKPLPKLPPAIISVLKSLARFISLYLINNHELFHLSVINPMPMPSLIECLQKPRLNAKKNILSKQQFTLSLNSSGATANIQCVFTADKVVELFLATELYDEAIYFLNSINDWKSSFLINCVLKESSNYQTIDQNSTLSTKFFAEHQLVFKVSSILGLGVDDGVWHDFESCLMEKKYEQSASVVLKELLVCSVVTKSPILEPILNNLMRNFVACTHQMCSSSIIVPENFYLPAPPIFCTQLNCEDNEAFADQFALHESKYRNKLCTLSKCIIVLFKESNLFVPMIKWYLENLSLAKGDMTNVYGIKNKFSLDLSLNTLLSSIRYQKIGYIPQPIFSLFREFVVLLFLIDLRDKFCQALRHFYKLMAKSANSSTAYVDLSCKIIKYGMLILSFRTLMASEYERIQDIVLSTMAKLAPSSQHSSGLDLEYELLRCVEEKLFVANLALDKDNLVNSHGQGFNVRHKFEAIREEWKKSGRSAANLDMNDLDTFEHKMKIVKNQSQLIQNHYGIGEDIFHMKYVQNISSLDDSLCGAFAVERSDLMGHFLEFFFKFAFDQSENWEAIVHHVNNIPLIPQFYEAIREQELNKNELKKYVLKNTAGHVSAEWSTDLHINLTKQRRSRLSTNSSKQHKQSTKSLVDAELFTKNGLFRTYSLKNIDHTRSSLGKKISQF